MKIRKVMTLAFCASVVWGNAASAQVIADVIGQTVASTMADQQLATCLSRTTSYLSDKEAHEADIPTQDVMTKYWAVASASDNARIDSLYHQLGRARWVIAGADVRVRSKAITDPFARSQGNVLVDAPVAFVRGGYGDKARGVWEVRTSSGGVAGHYLADFLRGPDWRLTRLELLSSDSPVPEIRPFCQTPGDIDAFREAQASIPESWIAKTVKKSEQVASCIEGPDCAERWSRARIWVRQNSVFPLARDTDTLLLTPRSIYGDTALSIAVALDPPAADGRRDIRFRAWCGNFITCFPTPKKARDEFVASLLRPSSISGEERGSSTPGNVAH